jgi:hypothetical protein
MTMPYLDNGFAPTSAPTYEPVESGVMYMWIGIGFALTLVIAVYLDMTSRKVDNNDVYKINPATEEQAEEQ